MGVLVRRSFVTTPQRQEVQHIGLETNHFVPKHVRAWEITQNLFDPEEENLWYIEGEVDLDQWQGVTLVAVTEIGT